MIKILFVCTGNICRSPSAEAVLRHYISQSGCSTQWFIDSAGTHGYHVGEAPDSRAQSAAKKRGINMAGIKARKVIADDFVKFDHIVAMDQGHYRLLEAIAPEESKATLSLFLDYFPKADSKDVPDPYYDGDEAFEFVLDILEQGTIHLIEKIKP